MKIFQNPGRNEKLPTIVVNLNQFSDTSVLGHSLIPVQILSNNVITIALLEAQHNKRRKQGLFMRWCKDWCCESASKEKKAAYILGVA